jgi:hypothetical protein
VDVKGLGEGDLRELFVFFAGVSECQLRSYSHRRPLYLPKLSHPKLFRLNLPRPGITGT